MFSIKCILIPIIISSANLLISILQHIHNGWVVTSLLDDNICKSDVLFCVSCIHVVVTIQSQLNIHAKTTMDIYTDRCILSFSLIYNESLL